MYVPPLFDEKDLPTLHRLVESHPLGTLVTLEAGSLNANHLPFELDVKAGPQGTLRAHVSRANPVWRNIDKTMEALAIFQGPSAYVTPSWYATKGQSGEVVPTYNYMVVHAFGPILVVEDPAWLRALVTRLTLRHEAGFEKPWAVDDAPEGFIASLLPAIVGVEIPLTRLQASGR